jgi:glutamate-1-semialdehyde 2,1-aminomutase
MTMAVYEPGEKSASLLKRAVQVIPGGVNSPVRAFSAVGGQPPFIDRAEGCRVQDVDGRWYIDLVGSWGPMILGHRNPIVERALQAAITNGTSFGAATEGEVDFAEVICERVPGCDSVRLVNSGTEATMSALRLARAATGRDVIIKFDGCYHGHSDGLLVSAGSGALTLGVPNSPGVPAAIAKLTLTLPYNDLNAVREALSSHSVAAIIVEPIAGNMGCVPPSSGYLEGLRELCTAHGALLIMDEVMTGFRVAHGGAQQRFGVVGDLVCLGKVIGGGLPVGAYGGRRELMEQMAPAGPVYQAGTLSGNPLAVAAGQAMLGALTPDVYDLLEERGARLQAGIEAAISRTGGGVTMQRVGSMFCLYFSDAPVSSLEEAKACDTERFGRFFQGLLTRGVYAAPSAFEAAFIGTAHDDEVIDELVSAIEGALGGA